jgi:hypothetical protein
VASNLPNKEIKIFMNFKPDLNKFGRMKKYVQEFVSKDFDSIYPSNFIIEDVQTLDKYFAKYLKLSQNKNKKS